MNKGNPGEKSERKTIRTMVGEFKKYHFAARVDRIKCEKEVEKRVTPSEKRGGDGPGVKGDFAGWRETGGGNYSNTITYGSVDPKLE